MLASVLPAIGWHYCCGLDRATGRKISLLEDNAELYVPMAVSM